MIPPKCIKINIPIMNGIDWCSSVTIYWFYYTCVHLFLPQLSINGVTGPFQALSPFHWLVYLLALYVMSCFITMYSTWSWTGTSPPQAHPWQHHWNLFCTTIHATKVLLYYYLFVFLIGCLSSIMLPPFSFKMSGFSIQFFITSHGDSNSPSPHML